MVDIETLQPLSFFELLTPEQLAEFARIGEEVPVNAGDTIFQAGEPATRLFLLLSGSVEISTESQDRYYDLDLHRNFRVGEIQPGDVFGLSALIRPYVMTASAQAIGDSQILQFPALRLRKLMAADHPLGMGLLEKINEALMVRLTYTRRLLVQDR